MAATSTQKSAFVTAFRAYTEQHRRIMDQAIQLQALYTDLGLSTITDADLTGDNAGLLAADVNAALTTAGAIIGEWTAARRASYNKLGHGAP
jgi:hypothetical protein